jgi:hypothetical protein
LITKAKIIKIFSPDIHSPTDFQEVLGATWPHNWSCSIGQRFLSIVIFYDWLWRDLLDKMFNLSNKGLN